MRFQLDNALSPRIAEGLSAAGHDAVHLRHYRMRSAADHEVLARALAEDRILISSDMHFGIILSDSGQEKPSVLLFRRASRRPAEQLDLLLTNLPVMTKLLEEGSIIILESTRMRVHRLPADNL